MKSLTLPRPRSRWVFAVLAYLRDFASRLVLRQEGEQRVTSVPWSGGAPR